MYGDVFAMSQFMWSLGSFEIQEISFKVGGHQDQQASAIQEMLQIAKLQSFHVFSGSVWSFCFKSSVSFLTDQNIFKEWTNRSRSSTCLTMHELQIQNQARRIRTKKRAKNFLSENKAKLILQKHVWRSFVQKSLCNLFGNFNPGEWFNSNNIGAVYHQKQGH